MRQHRDQKKKKKTENKHTEFGEPWGNIKLSSILGILVPEGGEEKGKTEKWLKVMAKFEDKHYQLTDPRNSRNSNQKNHKIRPRHMIKQSWWKTVTQLKILKSSHIKEDITYRYMKSKRLENYTLQKLTKESWDGHNNFRCKVTSKQGVLPGIKRNIA